MRRSVLAGSILGIFIAFADVEAVVIYDQGSPNLGDGSAEMTHWKVANRFTLSAAYILTSVKFWDLEAAPADFQSVIVWEIRANTGSNLPGAVLFSGNSSNLTHTATGRHASPYLEYVNTFNIGAISLGAGSYWLVLHNGPLSYTAPTFDLQRTYWESANTNRSDASYGDEAPFTNDWGSNDLPPEYGLPPGNSQLAFQLNGVPETYRPRVTAVGFTANGAPRVNFTTVNGQTYRVEYKNSLLDASWTTVSGASSVAGTGNVVQVSDPDPNAKTIPRRFYRVLLLVN